MNLDAIREKGVIDMRRLSLFYPLAGFVLTLIIFSILLFLGRFEGKEWLEALSVGYTVVFIISMMENGHVTTFAALIFGCGHISQGKRADSKGAMIKGKQWNIVITAVIAFVAGFNKLLTISGGG